MCLCVSNSPSVVNTFADGTYSIATLSKSYSLIASTQAWATRNGWVVTSTP